MALAYVEREVKGRTFKRVLEFGSLDINGTVRDVIAADHYHGIDQVAGPGVDEVRFGDNGEQLLRRRAEALNGHTDDSST